MSVVSKLRTLISFFFGVVGFYALRVPRVCSRGEDFAVLVTVGTIHIEQPVCVTTWCVGFGGMRDLYTSTFGCRQSVFACGAFAFLPYFKRQSLV